MDNIELLQATILLIMFWYAGLALIEITTERKSQWQRETKNDFDQKLYGRSD